jgi:hypothetical protein
MNNIVCFWTGTNPMSAQRKACLAQLREKSECEVCLVTPDNLADYILKDHPLHPAYEFLSETHKADYLRTYFMNFHGGGYSDIKVTTGSWKSAFMALAADDNKWINGYPEFPTGVAYLPHAKYWNTLVGNGAYICKPNTPLTNLWYSEMIKLLDERFEALRENPARHPQDQHGLNGSKYPLEWNEMLGRIFHRISYDFRAHILNTLPISIFHSYR